MEGQGPGTHTVSKETQLKACTSESPSKATRPMPQSLAIRRKGAVPLEEGDMTQLLQQLYLQQHTLTGTDQLLLLRDGFLFS